MAAENPKKYDQAFKSLSDRSPRELLDVFGVLRIEDEAQVEALPRDISMRPLAIDTAYLIHRQGEQSYIAIFEAITSWKREFSARFACYGGLMGMKYQLPVHFYVLPLAPHACPKTPPLIAEGAWGDVNLSTRLRWIKPWEIEGRAVLDRGWPDLEPWAVLFDLTREQEEQVLRRLNHAGRGQDASLFRLLGGMRYRKKKQVWIDLLERMKAMIRPELFLESLAVEDWREEGREEGRHEGSLIEARRALSAVVHARFPNLKATTIPTVLDVAALRALIPKVSIARDEAAVRRLLRK